MPVVQGLRRLRAWPDREEEWTRRINHGWSSSSTNLAQAGHMSVRACWASPQLPPAAACQRPPHN
ncbi:hypothetical protein HaLaN_28309, partial [Haematococcus lacustris]